MGLLGEMAAEMQVPMHGFLMAIVPWISLPRVRNMTHAMTLVAIKRTPATINSKTTFTNSVRRVEAARCVVGLQTDTTEQ